MKTRNEPHVRVNPNKWQAHVKIKNMVTGQAVERVVKRTDRMSFGASDISHHKVSIDKCDSGTIPAYLDCWNGMLYLCAGESASSGKFSPSRTGIFVVAPRSPNGIVFGVGDVLVLQNGEVITFLHVGHPKLPPGHLKWGGALSITRSPLFDRNSPYNTKPLPPVARRIIEPLTHIGRHEGNMGDISCNDFYMSPFQACVERAKGKRWVLENIDTGKFLYKLLGRFNERNLPVKLKKGSKFCVGKSHFVVSRMRRGKKGRIRAMSKRTTMVFMDNESNGEAPEVLKSDPALVDLKKGKSLKEKSSKDANSKSARRLSKASVVPVDHTSEAEVDGKIAKSRKQGKGKKKKKDAEKNLDAESLAIMNANYVFSKDKAYAANYRLKHSEHTLEVVQKPGEHNLDDADHFIEFHLSRGPARNRCVTSTSNWISIGSAQDNDVCIADRSISAKHACVVFDPDGREYYLFDRESEYGTYLVLEKNPKVKKDKKDKKPKSKSKNENENGEKEGPGMKDDSRDSSKSESEDDDVEHDFNKLARHRSEVLCGDTFVIARTEVVFHGALSEGFVQDIKDCCSLS